MAPGSLAAAARDVVQVHRLADDKPKSPDFTTEHTACTIDSAVAAATIQERDSFVRCKTMVTALGKDASTARELVDGASFGPDALKAIGQAFDLAWAEIANNFGNDTSDVEKARLRLAKALLSVAHEDSREVDVLKRAALQRMALDYRRRT